ncbi:hypothetical protein, partial [Neisseria meningitidis]|uniref:hypothetical protein n=1 Tax=Neisseria meningitidis TaxID=487 RepID=UPI001C9A0F7E
LSTSLFVGSVRCLKETEIGISPQKKKNNNPNIQKISQQGNPLYKPVASNIFTNPSTGTAAHMPHHPSSILYPPATHDRRS